MEKKLWPVFIFTFFLAISMWAQAGPDFTVHGYDLLTVTSRNGQTIYKLVDGEGLVFSVVTESELTRPQLGKVVYFHDIFTDWNYLEIGSMTYVFYERELEINIVPASFSYRGEDFTRYIPAGIGFFHTGVTEYNFRLSVEGFYPRIQGRLYTEEDLCEVILAAIRSPERAVEPKEEEIQQMRATRGDVSDLEKQIRELRAALEEMGNRQEELTAGLENLELANSELRDRIEKIRMAVMVFHNMGLFGNIHTVDRGSINRILQLKEEDPDIRQEEAARILRKEGIPLSAHEIFLMYGLYFNEFN